MDVLAGREVPHRDPDVVDAFVGDEEVREVWRRRTQAHARGRSAVVPALAHGGNSTSPLICRIARLSNHDIREIVATKTSSCDTPNKEKRREIDGSSGDQSH